MCDVCIVNAVKDRMISRRSFFRAGAALVVGAPAHRGGSGGPARIFAMV